MYELPKNLLNNLRFGNFDIKNGYENLTITLNSAWKPFIENSTFFRSMNIKSNIIKSRVSYL